MPDSFKYIPPEPFNLPDRKWPSRQITTSPVWCSVDLRDGNQSLPNPLGPGAKLEFFKLLCDLGFKHIEVAFPSASNDDFDFTRKLIDEGHIPEDVFIMGLTQCREHLVQKTFEAISGIPRAIVHAYAATSELHMQQVFNLNHNQTIEMAVKTVEQIRDLASKMESSDIRLEFSPEEFTDTDIEFAIDICEAVFAAWGQASPEKPLIFNLPATVERRPPNHYADMIEIFCNRFSQRDCIQVSLHSHNDQGMAVAATELALMAGADRVEGTLFGHGERTGNVDLVTLINNLASRGIETGIDFTNLEHVVQTVARLTGMDIYYRQPYSGELVFTAFSGSHQDAIRKGMQKHLDSMEKSASEWKVPYLLIDPADLGREYRDLIRINSQSGKGGIAWILEHDHGLHLPKMMHPQLGKVVQQRTDQLGRELESNEVMEIFRQEFLQLDGPYRMIRYWPRPDEDNPAWIHGQAIISVNGKEQTVSADGDGPIDAFANCIRSLGTFFKILDYDSHAIGKGSDASAMAYVPLEFEDGSLIYGAGTDTNIDQAAIKAVLAGLNRHTMTGREK